MPIALSARVSVSAASAASFPPTVLDDGEVFDMGRNHQVLIHEEVVMGVGASIVGDEGSVLVGVA